MIWVPLSYVSPIFMLYKKLQLLRAAKENALHITDRLIAEQTELRNAEQKLRDDIEKIRGKNGHRYKITKNGTCSIPAGIQT